jgi:chromosome segregation ATPase
MRNFILLLALISGLLAGYLIGDYRGKDARESLKKAVETGKTLASEHESAITKLKTELDGINDKHHSELEAIRKENESRMTAWRRTKDGLDDKIKRSSAQLAESDSKLKSLVTQRDNASGANQARLDLEIERLRKEREDLRREIEGNACLQIRVPHSVSTALNEAHAAGRK